MKKRKHIKPTEWAWGITLSKLFSRHLYTSPLIVPLNMTLPRHAQTHKIVCSSPVFPNTPRLDDKEFPHSVQNWKRTYSSLFWISKSDKLSCMKKKLTFMCFTPHVTSLLSDPTSHAMSKTYFFYFFYN